MKQKTIGSFLAQLNPSEFDLGYVIGDVLVYINLDPKLNFWIKSVDVFFIIIFLAHVTRDKSHLLMLCKRCKDTSRLPLHVD